SLDSGSFKGGPDLLRSGPGGSFGGGYDSSFPSSRFDNEESGWDSSDFSPPLLRPAPIGSRGRGMPVYLQNKFGGRSSDWGGPPVLRGQGRGVSTESVEILFHPHPLTLVALTWTVGTRSTQMVWDSRGPAVDSHLLYRLCSAAGNPPVLFTESVEERQRRARREKQKRKREKDIEKYGDMHRLAFTCAFCKVRTCDVEEIEEHFGSQFHWETLDHIEKQTKFDKKVIVFLHESMVNKFRKTVLRKRSTMVVKQEVCLSRVEMIHCMACRAHFPASLVSVQQHLRSAEHQKSQQEFSETQKRESVLTATSIMTNPIVKVRYEKYLKVTDPQKYQRLRMFNVREIKRRPEQKHQLSTDNEVEVRDLSCNFQSCLQGENPFEEELKEESARCGQEELPDGSMASQGRLGAL
uniref:DBIRD complex subunit ZNF326 n=1 Tax=Scleropages formosus TaxID=113540 RepID=A0A8C9S6Q9_SCLFO